MDLKTKRDQELTEAYAVKFLADNSRNTPANNETLEKTFRNCVLPAKTYLYESIKKRIEEMRHDNNYKFYDDEE